MHMCMPCSKLFILFSLIWDSTIRIILFTFITKSIYIRSWCVCVFLIYGLFHRLIYVKHMSDAMRWVYVKHIPYRSMSFFFLFINFSLSRCNGYFISRLLYVCIDIIDNCANVFSIFSSSVMLINLALFTSWIWSQCWIVWCALFIWQCS